MALKHVMINDIIAEQTDRMRNLKKYYPFFVLYENTFSQFKEGKYQSLDMGYITLASLRFFINENNFHEKDITYEEYEAFLLELLHRDFDLSETPTEEKELVIYIFDKIKNDGKAFEFKFFDPETKQRKISRVKLVESQIKNGMVLYHVTSDGIEFYLDTKEVKDESKINIQQLLLEKMISSNNFKGGIDVVRRINSEVIKLKLEKETVIKLLSIDVYEGAKACEEYMAKTSKWFTEEQKLFAKNKALVDKAIEKAQFEQQQPGKVTLKSAALTEISLLETELKKTIYNHSELIAETTSLSQISDQIISHAKLRKLRPVFDFNEALKRMYKEDKPQNMEFVLKPFFGPKIFKSFSINSIDNILTLKSDDKLKGEKIEKGNVDLDYVYEDEKLDMSIGRNFSMLFVELMERLAKWKKVSLKELNAILEIKFGEEIYDNRDYYSFLVHLSGKKHYSLQDMINKQDTMLEEMVISNMPDADKEKYADISFDIEFSEERIMYEPVTEKLPDKKVKKGSKEESEETTDDSIMTDKKERYVTNMVFTIVEGSGK